MKKILFFLLCPFLLNAKEITASNDTIKPLIRFESPYSVKETADRYEKNAKAKGLRIMARVNHQKNAQSVQMALRPTEVIIFGNPRAGTPLMQCSQEFAIDLPQKALIYQDENNKVWLAYNNPSYLKQKHDMSACRIALNKVNRTLKGLALNTVE